MNPQEAEHAIGDPLARRGDVEPLADQAGDPGQLLALVALPRERRPEARVLEHERHLLREARQQDHLRLGEALAGQGGKDQAPGGRAGGRDGDGGQGVQAPARDRGTRGRSEREIAKGEHVGGAEGPALAAGALAEGELRGRFAGCLRQGILGGDRHPGHRGRVGLEAPDEARATGAEKPHRGSRDALGGPDDVDRVIRRRAHRPRVQPLTFSTRRKGAEEGFVMNLARRVAESHGFQHFILVVILVTAVLVGLETSETLATDYGWLFDVADTVVQRSS